MEDIQIFNSKEFGDVRALELSGTPWFVGKDVAEALGYGAGKSLAKAYSPAH